MIDIFMFTFHAIGPIVVLMLLGYLLKKIHMLDDNFLKIGNRFVFHVLLPALLFYNVYSIENLASVAWSSIIYAICVVFLLFVIGFVAVKIAVPDNRQKGVVLQCVFRSNYAIIGLYLAESIGGKEGLQFAAVLSAFGIPIFNVLAVTALSLFVSEDNEKVDFRGILTNIAKNPLIRAILTGLIFVGIRSLIPRNDAGELVFSLKNNLPILYEVIGDLASGSSFFALIVLGGLFEFKAVKKMYKEILFGTIGRTVVAPVLGVGLAVLGSRLGILSVTQNEYPAFVALFGSPVAVSSAVMAAGMKNDEQLASQLVVWTSLASMFTLFILIFIMKYFRIIA